MRLLAGRAQTAGKRSRGSRTSSTLIIKLKSGGVAGCSACVSVSVCTKALIENIVVHSVLFLFSFLDAAQFWSIPFSSIPFHSVLGLDVAGKALRG